MRRTGVVFYFCGAYWQFAEDISIRIRSLLLMREVAWHRHDGGREILLHTKKSLTITASDHISNIIAHMRLLTDRTDTTPRHRQAM